ncbi:hypothetical protein GCM10016234_39650 [Tianweitania populi]|uniref:Uncharacterized protein n=1 Tax=Tianweitania populi TaxID=1607949 RepID=A0A8J3DTC0_9HYPH|nr:hypothetical protein GCM10016234_39650 [Tianweitania populi]
MDQPYVTRRFRRTIRAPKRFRQPNACRARLSANALRQSDQFEHIRGVVYGIGCETGVEVFNDFHIASPTPEGQIA